MAAAHVMLRFIRGVDLSGTDFENTTFPAEIKQLSNVRWMRLDRSGLDMIPTAVNTLPKLEYLSMQSNKLLCIPPSVKQLSNLRTLRASHNDLEETDISPDLFSLEELVTLDLSHNRVSSMPEHLAAAQDLLVLSLAHNEITEIPSSVFVNLTDLEYLDLSYNKISSVPAQLRRLSHLKTLVLSNNPLDNDKLRGLTSLEELTRLDLRATGRTLKSFTPEWADLFNLTELDISANALPSFPEPVLLLLNLRRLNISDNDLGSVPAEIGELEELHSLILSRNRIKRLPNAMGRLKKLKLLAIGHNKLTELPDVFDDLANSLRRLIASNNQLSELPATLFSCRRLKLLDVRNNAIEEVPEEIHALPSLHGNFLHAGNPNMVIAAKPEPPADPQSETYFVDFSSTSPTRRRRGSVTQRQADRLKRRINGEGAFHERRRSPEKSPSKIRSVSSGALGERISKNLRQKSDPALSPSDRGQVDMGPHDHNEAESLSKELGGNAEKRPRKWQDGLQRPDLDFGQLFGHDAGSEPGLQIWRMENFYPMLVPSLEHGRFYEGDCYIVLSTSENPDDDNHHTIYFWIGSKSSLDKKASAAIHAVNLRNYLKAQSTTRREEQEDESRHFLKLFDNNISYIQGGLESGFFQMEIPIRPPRLFVLLGRRSLKARALPLSVGQLHKDHVYLLDADEEKAIYLWWGENVSGVRVHKARLFCEKMAADDKSEIVEMPQGQETSDFLSYFVPEAEDDHSAQKEVVLKASSFGIDFVEPKQLTKLMEMRLGDSHLELPQMVHAGRDLLPSMLNTSGVYLLDDTSEIFIWVGRRSSRLVQAAASRVAAVLGDILHRPAHFQVTTVREGTEPLVFKSKFKNWDDVIHTDFRAKDIISFESNVLKRRQRALASSHDVPASPVSTGGQSTPLLRSTFPRQLSAGASPSPMAMARPVSRQASSTSDAVTISVPQMPSLGSDFVPPEVDLDELFGPKPELMTEDEARKREDEWMDDLEQMDVFILSGGEAARLDKDHIGHFFSAECYIVLCRQWVLVDKGKGGQQDQSEANGDDQDLDDEDEPLEELECVAYFWQGRDAKRTAWHTFSFSETRRRLHEMSLRRFGVPMKLVRQQQQQETMKFLTLFNREMVIHKGKSPQSRSKASAFAAAGKAGDDNDDTQPALFHVHQQKPSVFTRTVQVDADPSRLHPCDCFILRVPFDGQQTQGIMYVWQGDKAVDEVVDTALEVSKHKMWGSFTVQLVQQGQEPKHFFWSALKVDDPAQVDVKPLTPLTEGRLFECSNKFGHFVVTEKLVDFCQDDLDDDNVYILDTSQKVFLWIGPYASDVVIKLSQASAAEYWRRTSGGAGQGPIVVFKGNEPFEFRMAFHGWSSHLDVGKDLGKSFAFLGQVVGSNNPRQFYSSQQEHFEPVESAGERAHGKDMEWKPRHLRTSEDRSFAPPPMSAKSSVAANGDAGDALQGSDGTEDDEDEEDYIDVAEVSLDRPDDDYVDVEELSSDRKAQGSVDAAQHARGGEAEDEEGEEDCDMPPSSPPASPPVGGTPSSSVRRHHSDVDSVPSDDDDVDSDPEDGGWQEEQL